MNKKTIIGIIILIFIAGGILFYNQLSGITIREIAKETPGYNCPLDEPCVTCMYKGMVCECETKKCECGNHTVNRTICEE